MQKYVPESSHGAELNLHWYFLQKHARIGPLTNLHHMHGGHASGEARHLHRRRLAVGVIWPHAGSGATRRQDLPGVGVCNVHRLNPLGEEVAN